MRSINAFAANSEKNPFQAFEYTLPDIGPDQVDIKVKYCGVCHSDLSMLDNEWGIPVICLFLDMKLWGQL